MVGAVLVRQEPIRPFLARVCVRRALPEHTPVIGKPQPVSWSLPVSRFCDAVLKHATKRHFARADYFMPYPAYSYPYYFNCWYSSVYGAITCQYNQYCAGGYYYDYIKSSCELKPPGYSTYDSNSMLYVCDAGSYSTSETSYCPICSYAQLFAAAYCVFGEVNYNSSHVCPAGTYLEVSASGTYICKLVPGGYFSPFKQSLAYYTCQEGYYSAAGSSSCSECASGTVSSFGASSCSPCPAGSVASEGSGRCELCSSGTFAPVEGMKECWSCPPGTYSDASGVTTCTPVPAGYYMPQFGASNYFYYECFFAYSEGAVNCLEPQTESLCRAGQFYETSVSACSATPAGYYNPFGNSTVLFVCAPGTYSTGGSSQCAVCSASTLPGATRCNTDGPSSNFCLVGQILEAGKCVDVRAGEYNPFGGSVVSYSCPSGRYSLRGSSSCNECPSYSAPLFTDVGAAVCSTCPPGRYSYYTATSSNSDYECALIPAGRYFDNGTNSLTSCPGGSYGPTGNNRSYCPVCAEGTYSYYWGGSQYCSVCDAASYSGLGAVYCSYCSSSDGNRVGAGTCESATYVTLASEYNCTVGEYLAVNGCVDVPAGHYAPSPQSRVFYSCQPGTVYNSTIADCQSCSAGYYSPGSVESCIPCVAGSYSSGSGEYYCSVCSAGYYSVVASTSCALCPEGSTSTVGASTSKAVRAGKSSNYGPYVYSCSYAGAPGGVNCFSNSYSFSVSSSGESIKKRTKSIVSVSLSVASRAYGFNYYSRFPPGYARFSLNKYMAFICPEGYYSKTAHLGCRSCPTSVLAGAAVCATGEQRCPAGSYTVDGQCKPAPAGYYSPFALSGALYGCGAGYSSTAGANACFPCSTGKYSSSFSSECLACPAGRTSSSGSSYCNDCTTGMYSLHGFCMDCPAGTYTVAYGSVVCDAVDAGFYSDGSSGIRPCGFSVASGAINCDMPIIMTMHFSSCAAGSYWRFLNGAESFSVKCVEAPAGFYVPVNNSFILYICPVGFVDGW
jgi:hypothetical protein